MSLFDVFKTFGAINKATKFIKDHEETVNKVKNLIANVETGVDYLKAHRDEIEAKIDKAKAVVEKLKGILK